MVKVIYTKNYLNAILKEFDNMVKKNLESKPLLMAISMKVAISLIKYNQLFVEWISLITLIEKKKFQKNFLIKKIKKSMNMWKH